MLLLLVMVISAVVRRLHDLRQSGFLVVPILVLIGPLEILILGRLAWSY